MVAVGRGCKKWSSEVKSIGFADMGSTGKNTVREDCFAYGLSDWVAGSAISWNGEDFEGSRVFSGGGHYLEFVLARIHVKAVLDTEWCVGSQFQGHQSWATLMAMSGKDLQILLSSESPGFCYSAVLLFSFSCGCIRWSCILTISCPFLAFHHLLFATQRTLTNPH